MTVVLPVLIASILGSPHCLAMCGPFVCLYAHDPDAPTLHLSHLAYHGARLLSYLTMGALAGFVGSSADLAALAPGLPRTSAMMAGLFMILWGMFSIGRALGLRPRWPGTHRTGQLARRLAAPLANRSVSVRAFGLGLLTAILPCGWLWVFVATAAGTGSAMGGAVTMGVFWVGTVPMLLTVAWTARRVLGAVGQRLPLATAVVVLLLGFLTLFGRLDPQLLSSGVGHAGH